MWKLYCDLSGEDLTNVNDYFKITVEKVHVENGEVKLAYPVRLLSGLAKEKVLEAFQFIEEDFRLKREEAQLKVREN